jgi:hypothetical protein
MPIALAILGVAVVMVACMQGWNAAEHRKAVPVARVMAILFFLFTAIFLALLAKMIFF